MLKFTWSKRRYKIRQLVKQFLKTLPGDYDMWTKEHHEIVMKVKKRIKKLGAEQKVDKVWRKKPMITALLNYYAEIRGKEPSHHKFEKYTFYYEYDRKKILEEFTVPVA